MIFKFEGKEIDVPDDFMIKCGEHAEARGMTLEEYIAEAFTMYKNQLDEKGSLTSTKMFHPEYDE